MSTLSALPFLRDEMTAQSANAPTRTPLSARIGTQIAAIARAFWRGLERTGQLRARQHLLDLAWQYEATQPSLARDLRGAAKRIVEG